MSGGLINPCAVLSRQSEWRPGVPFRAADGRGDRVMSLFLLLLGAATTAAGLILMASGVVVHDGAFDAETVTPGTVAAVGGLLLIGMGLAVRELQRIERALASRGKAPLDVSLAEMDALWEQAKADE